MCVGPKSDQIWKKVLCVGPPKRSWARKVIKYGKKACENSNRDNSSQSKEANLKNSVRFNPPSLQGL